MGIVNVTPDSFSDGGELADSTAAIERALEMERDGAAIIDIGGESSRPGSEPVDTAEELQRVLPVVKGIRDSSNIPISIDTRKAAIARAALDAGANIVNDISALRDDADMADVVREYGCPVIIMHMKGTPATMQDAPYYEDVVSEVTAFLKERIAECYAREIEYIIVDPGIGFGKRLQDNLDLLRGLGNLRMLGVPVLVGTSRKRFVGDITGQEVGQRRGGSLASALVSAMNGASIVRVHDVRDTVSALAMLTALTEQGERTYAL
jgi:dihydropteroate synthase